MRHDLARRVRTRRTRKKRFESFGNRCAPERIHRRETARERDRSIARFFDSLLRSASTGVTE